MTWEEPETTHRKSHQWNSLDGYVGGTEDVSTFCEKRATRLADRWRGRGGGRGLQGVGGRVDEIPGESQQQRPLAEGQVDEGGGGGSAAQSEASLSELGHCSPTKACCHPIDLKTIT
ncbi:hypothetical protein THAOC_37178, partial [Thalassiosira oceanica]